MTTPDTTRQRTETKERIMNTTDEVLVVGAGPVGLTTAAQLARFGVPVRVVDAPYQPTTESRAVSVHARSMEMLAALGVLPRMEARGRRIDAIAMLDGRTGATGPGSTSPSSRRGPAGRQYARWEPHPHGHGLLSCRALVDLAQHKPAMPIIQTGERANE
jgi:2-polyprenyl-6-methoxyphenol hydroxylase-like FAD-dependent oxidoreductase